jgi:hypothetical protein
VGIRRAVHRCRGSGTASPTAALRSHSAADAQINAPAGYGRSRCSTHCLSGLLETADQFRRRVTLLERQFLARVEAVGGLQPARISSRVKPRGFHTTQCPQCRLAPHSLGQYVRHRKAPFEALSGQNTARSTKALARRCIRRSMTACPSRAHESGQQRSITVRSRTREELRSARTSSSGRTSPRKRRRFPS